MRIAQFVRGMGSSVLNLVILACACVAPATAQPQGSKQTSAQASAAESQATRRAKMAAAVEGSVFDVKTHAPVANAIVEWSFDDEHRHTGFTNAQGKFKFLVARSRRRDRDHDHDADRDKDRNHDRDRDRDRDRDDFDIDANGEVLLRTIANLYEPEQKRIQVANGKTVTVEIPLKPKPLSQIGVVKGKLTNEYNGKPLPKAIVTIFGAGQALSTTTGPDGSYTISDVGFNSNLRIRFQTPDAPCIETTDRVLKLERPEVTVNVSLPILEFPILHCSLPAFPTFPPFPPLSGPTLPTDQNINWQQADIFTIQMNANADSWNTGHVNDILKFPDEPGGWTGALMVAAHSGGVWQIMNNSQAWVVSDNWPGTSMTSLALGPDGDRDVFAATATRPGNSSQGGLLFETDTSASFPTLNWKQVTGALQCGSIYKVLVIPQVRRIVLACDTGVYWSEIPAAPSVNGTFTWHDATPSNLGPLPRPYNGKALPVFSGLARGPGWTSTGGEGTIVASRWGGSLPGQAIYYGQWSGGTLQFNSSFVQQSFGQLATWIGRSSVASCASSPSLMFAIAEDGNDNFAGVWKSTDGGVNWSFTTFPINPGPQGSYNQAIAISPDCKIVALGWNGTFISHDGGGSWNQLQDLADLTTNPNFHLHHDIHALTFDPSHADTLFIGSDGGIASASGLNNEFGYPTFRSNWNKQVFVQQIYHADASSATPGLVAAGLQDNGVVWAGLPGPWQHATDCFCDGRWSRFFTPAGVPPGNSILLEEEFSLSAYPYGWTPATGNNVTFKPGGQGDILVFPGPPGTLGNVFTEVVHRPGAFQNQSGQSMYAAAGGIGNAVYGLFANDDGSNVNWEPIGNIGGSQNITAVSPTSDGSSVFVGSDQGNICRLDSPYTDTPTQLTINAPPGAKGANISGLAGFFSTIAYASVNYGGNGYVMFWNGATWDAVSGSPPSNLPYTSIVAPNLNDLYVSTGGPIYDSHDAGRTWNLATKGLPTVSQAAELRIVADPSGTYLYLASFGRSLWKARLF